MRALHNIENRLFEFLELENRKIAVGKLQLYLIYMPSHMYSRFSNRFIEFSVLVGIEQYQAEPPVKSV